MIKQIEGYERYYITSEGIVLSKNKTGKVKELQPHINHNGYKRVNLCKGGKYKKFFVHRLVATAFIGEIPEGYQINHKDSDRLNNAVDNLEIVSASENIRHSIEFGKKDFNYLERAVMGTHKDTGDVVVFKSMTEAEATLGICKSNILKVIKGQRTHTGGYIWSYVGGTE